MKDIFIDYFGNEHIKPVERIAKSRTSVYGLYSKNKKILLVKSRVHNLWEIPGGGVDEGETELEALKREFEEESGYSIKELYEVPIQIFNNNFHDPRMNVYYYNEMKFFSIKSALKIEDSVLDAREVLERDFIDLHKLNNSNCQQYTFKALQSLSKKNLSKHF